MLLFFVTFPTKNRKMQTILGAGGAIGTLLALELRKYTDQVRLVGRNPVAVHESDLLFSADLTDQHQTDRAVEGSQIVYLTVGLPYTHKIWEKNWPVIMENTINACIKHKSRLVFFDNVYMYDPDALEPMTENNEINPCSKKGLVRANVACTLMDHVQNGNLLAVIARAADFYGPSVAGNSVLTETVFKPLSEGKKANWLGRSDKKHSFTYTPDAARATAILGNSPEAYGEVWHLPTAPNPYTGREWVEQIALELNTRPKYRVVGKGMVKALGLFSSIMRESVEMLYQYDRHYVFDSTKFEKQFNIKPTPYPQGIREIIESDYK
jgi:nucleoside-diphosphate-sugar epimerase